MAKATATSNDESLSTQLGRLELDDRDRSTGRTTLECWNDNEKASCNLLGHNRPTQAATAALDSGSYIAKNS